MSKMSRFPKYTIINTIILKGKKKSYFGFCNIR